MSYANIQLFPKVSYRFDSVDSTNAAAIRAINAGEWPEPGAVFWAEGQSQGRGQGSKHWHASPGANLTVSIVAYPSHLPLNALFALNQLAGIAVAHTVQAFLPADLQDAVRLKWPNDVYVGHQKIAGILVQNGLRGNQLAWSVIGIGLNVNEAAFPADLAASATSLQILMGRPHDREVVATRLWQALSASYARTAPDQLAALGEQYHHLLYRLNVAAHYREVATGQSFRGTILGVDAAGQLRLGLEDGTERAFSLQQLLFL